MDRKELIDMIENGTSIVRNFIMENNASSNISGSYDDWNNNDVIGHIVGWMNYSIDKLSSLKLGVKLSGEYNQAFDLNEINKKLYNNSKNKNREEIETDYINSLGGYIKVVSIFSNKDMDLDTFDTGFKMELWRYIIMDMVIHPIQHIIYQYLKKNEYNRIAEVIENSKTIFGKYSPGMKAYELLEFEICSPEYQEKLKEMEIEFAGNNNVKDFVQMNKKEIAG